MITSKSINNNGISVCQQGKENYTTFIPAIPKYERTGTEFYQYDYRHTDGDLFTCVAPTLEDCRTRRDQWLENRSKK